MGIERYLCGDTQSMVPGGRGYNHPDRLSNGDSTPSVFKRIECIILRPVPVLYHFSW